ncbi:putative periplasmic protein kinase ArgK and related GTPases of G3E family [invertebrate metagenome]|uniref:Putative periplasmic protein kinase ArgK and related GTPases of G3E family n=1 Tax=invertebrate metagenome TaxID=1711999 RepID=A0A484H5R2_9ZZZZ
MEELLDYEILHVLATGGKAAVARAFAQIECTPDSEKTVALLDAAYAAPVGHVVGITGPPGVGKSTLMGSLINDWRAQNRTVGVIAVDPSSRRTGGALLGDRMRLTTDPEDQGLFIRSMAARDKLGGLAALTVSGMVLMRALYDIVLIETVGVGQSETDIASVADTVLFCIQPGSGDSLQFMKAGIVEIPHIVLVTKADMGKPAVQAQADVQAALSLVYHELNGFDPWKVPILLVAASVRQSIKHVIANIDSHAVFLRESGRLSVTRQTQAEQWLRELIQERFGREGVRRIGDLSLASDQSPFRRLQDALRIFS